MWHRAKFENLTPCLSAPSDLLTPQQLQHSCSGPLHQHVQYLPEELQPVLAGLDDGQRTPLFHLGGRGGNRYSWYLRLPIERTQPWAGIIRCEVPAAGSVADAVERANQVTALLPRYASEPHKDGRAPQNLYPIAGLENELRRRLGDQLLMERALRLAAK